MNKKVQYIIIGVAVGVALLSLYFIAEPKKKKIKPNAKLLFVGDSSTEALLQSGLIQKKMPSVSVTKLASVGKSTTWMLSQMTQNLNSNKYDAVVILGGYNDIYATNLKGTTSNLQKMYDLAHSKGIKVIAITPSPSGYHPYYSATKQSMHDNLNKFILSSNADIKIDFYSAMEDKSKKGFPRTNVVSVADRQHANLQGHEILATLISQKTLNT